MNPGHVPEPAEGFDLANLIAAIDARIAQGETAVVVNLKDVAFLNSQALGYLIRTRKLLLTRGGDLVLSEVSDVVARTLSLMGLDEVIRAFSTDQAAYAYLDAR